MDSIRVYDIILPHKPLLTKADEPVTKGWYAKNWYDLEIDLQGKISALEMEVKSCHTTDRSMRELDTASEHDQYIDGIKELLG